MTIHRPVTPSDAYATAGLDAPPRRSLPFTAFDLTPVSPVVGAEISGIDITAPLTDAAIAEIEWAIGEWGVVFFHGQTLTPETHLAFARRFGPIDVNRFFKAVDGHPEIAEVRKEADQRSNIGGGWHADHTYDRAPAKYSLLHARDLPSVGGDTLFASTEAAFEALSPGLRATLEGLRAVHSSRHVFGPGGRTYAGTDLAGRIGNPDLATQDAVHPVVFVNPVTGRKGLFVNPGFTVRFDGWSEAESAPLLTHLYEQVRRPEFTHRFRWRPGSLAIWDNRTTWHAAINDYVGERRLLHRITVAGEDLAEVPARAG